MASRRKVTFEKIAETEQGTHWHVEAIHATTTRNKRKYTKEELILAARSLSYRPININHDEKRWLSYDFSNPLSENSNCTMIMDWDVEKNAVSGDFWITDKTTNERIENGDIKTVSIEQVPYQGESCSCIVNDCSCEQKGIVFTGIACLETFKGVEPGDPNASIKKKESIDYTVKVEGSKELTDALKKAGGALKQAKKECGCKGKEQECPPGQHRMPDGSCMADDQMEQFKCEVCGATFENKDALDAHMAQHQTERIRRQFLEAVERESRKLVQAD